MEADINLPSDNETVPDGNNNDNVESGLQVGEVDVEAYDAAIFGKRDQLRGERKRRVMLDEMRQTGELLATDDSFYQVVQGIHKRLYGERKGTILVSLKDSLDTYTVPNAQTTVVTAGLVRQLADFLAVLNKPLHEDHLAFIWAHEQSHWDKEAKTFHLNETYCDTEAINVCSRAGYNLDCAVDTLKFLESIQDDDVQANESFVLITHPSSENRRILGESIINDPNIHLSGRYATPTELDSQVVENLWRQSQTYLEHKYRRSRIASMDVMRQELDRAETVEQMWEVVQSSDSLLRAQETLAIEQTKTFEDILLAFAVYIHQAGGGDVLSLIDFYTVYRAGLITEAVQPITFNPEKLQEAYTVTENAVASDMLIANCLNGEYADPLEVLIHPDDHPDFREISFDAFFRSVVKDLTEWGKIHPEAMWRLGWDEHLMERYAQTFTDGDQHIKAQQRESMLAELRPLMAAVVVKLARKGYSPDYSDSEAIHRCGDWGKILSGMTQELDANRPPMATLEDMLADRLLAIGWCQTPEVAHDMATILGQDYNHAGTVMRQQLGYWHKDAPPQALLSRDPQVQHDLVRSLLALHISLPPNKELQVFGQEWGPTTNLGDMIRHYFRVMTYEEITGIHGDLLFEQVLHVSPTVVAEGVDWENEAIDPVKALFCQEYDAQDEVWSLTEDDFKDNFVQQVNFFGTGAVVKLPERKTREWTREDTIERMFEDFSDRYRVNITDRNIAMRWLLEAEDERDNVIKAFGSNETLLADINFWKQVLEKGIETHAVSSDEVYQIVNMVQDEDLYKHFKSYLAGRTIDSFERAAFNVMRERLDEKLTFPLLLARFVEQGGLPNTDWEEVLLLWDEDYQFDRTDTLNAGRQMLTFLSQSQQLSGIQRRLQAMAIDWVRYGMGLTRLDEQEDRLGYYQLETFRADIHTCDELMEVLGKLPEGSLRDSYLTKMALTVLAIREDPSDEHEVNVDFGIAEVRRMLRLVSPRWLRAYDGEGVSLLSGMTQVAVDEDEVDVAYHFPYTREYESVLNNLLSVLRNASPEAGTSIEAMQQGIDYAESCIPHGCGMRDYLIERSLMSLTEPATRPERLDDAWRELLNHAFELAATPRTRGMLANILVEDALSRETSFEAGVERVLYYLPEYSTGRDVHLNHLMNTHSLTWKEINRGQELILGQSFRSNEKGVAVRSAVLEAVAYKIELMSAEERIELMTFLTDEREHVYQAKRLTSDFFTPKVRDNLEAALRGKRKVVRSTEYGLLQLQPLEVSLPDEIDVDIEAVITTLLSKYNPGLGVDAVSLPELVQDALAELTLANVFDLALPTTISKMFNTVNGDDTKILSATSMGHIFMTAPSQERREIVYRILLGKRGLYEDDQFDEAGQVLIDRIVDIATVNEGNQNVWTEHDRNMIQRVVRDTFAELLPSRRTEVMARFLDLVTYQGERLTKDRLLVAGLLALEGVGPKIGQTDALMPAWALNELAVTKENVPPIPLATIAQIVDKEGQKDSYERIGPILNSASVGVVVGAEGKGTGKRERVLKVIRPSLPRTYRGDLRAVGQALSNLYSEGVIGVDPTGIVKEIGTMMTEELQPQTEANNMRLMQQARDTSGSLVLMPNVNYVGKEFIDLALVKGVSLNTLLQRARKFALGKSLTDEEKQLQTVEVEAVEATFLADFFGTAVKAGVFHADPHPGNDWVNDEGHVVQLDYGQVGIEPDRIKREAFMPFLVGMATERRGMVARALRLWKPSLSVSEIEAALRREPNLTKAVGGALTALKIEGSINRFLKASVNLLPMMQSMPKQRMFRLLLPYMRAGLLRYLRD